MIAADVEWALGALRERHESYRLYQAYYDGNHRLAFATERFRNAFGHLFRAYALNLCAPVVDVTADRLAIIGWSRPDNAQAAAQDAQDLWERENMPARHGRLHRDALVQGDAYLSIWQDPDGRVRIYDEAPTQMVGAYDPGAPGELSFAVKVWRAGKRVRVTVYYRDRIERYASTTETDQIPEKANKLRPLQASDVLEGEDWSPEVPNAWDVVPVFHWANNPGQDGLGRSELHDVLPPQDALNKSVLDILVTGEAHGLPLRYLIGVEAEVDPTTGREIPLFSEDRNRVVTLPKGAEAGQWDAANLGPMVDVKREHAADISAVTGVPIHLITGVRNATDWPSGEALRVAESRLTSKAEDRITDWSPTWARLTALGLRMRQGGDQEVRALWKPTGTPDPPLVQAQTAAAKLAAGLPRAQVWREMGYSEKQITTMLAEADSDASAAAERSATAFSSGLDTGGL